ncbi:YqzM-like protein [Paenibacillus sp. UNCCL117]|nr:MULTISPECIES: YqzM family protein [unclassified Paenibacillus]SDE04133.1 YqzM-like protein [Paenibacillus sp. cl123]SFW57570.1 YqzM-like protein [Paenibacillus sp. UNCCL117]
MSNDPRHPELHVYEEQRNDFIDVALGFGVFFVVLLVIAVAATVISLVVK